MRAALLALALIVPGALIGSGCATTLNTPHAVVERAETDGELIYQGVVAAVNASTMDPRAKAALLHNVAVDLNTFRTAYNAGQDLTASVALLKADLATAKAHP